MDRRRGVQIGGRQFTLVGREVGGGDVHAADQLFGHQIHDKVAGGLDIPGGVFWPAGIAHADADDQINRIASDRVKEAERGKIDDASIAQAGHPGDRSGDNQVGQYLVIVGMSLGRWINLHGDNISGQNY